MRLAGGVGKSRRQDDNVHIAHGPKQFRKAQIVANRQAQFTERRIHRDNRFTRLDGFLFVIMFVAQIQIEQVNLVVARHDFTFVVID